MPISGAVCHQVIVDKMTFTPAVVNAAVGDCVRWLFRQAGHSVVMDDLHTDSGIMPIGTSFELTYDKSGFFPFHCGSILSMKGEVIVK